MNHPSPAVSGVTIVVCCYNAAGRIRPVLDHLGRQQAPAGLAIEIILVDNQSTDATAVTAQQHWEQSGYPFPLRVVAEKQQGLSFARLAGIRHASYPYLIFCDDDNWLSPGYAATVHRLMETHPAMGIAGGWPSAFAHQPLPAWFEAKKDWYACSKLHPATGWVPADSYVFGAGMAARTQLLLAIFDERWPMLCSDRKGQSLSSGGDYEICLRASLLGAGIWFDETLTLSHFMEPSKLTEAYTDRFYAMLPAHTFFLQKYKKCMEVQAGNRIKKGFLLGWNYLKYLLAQASGNTHTINFTKDYLFFLTGFAVFATPECRVVYDFAHKQAWNAATP